MGHQIDVISGPPSMKIMLRGVVHALKKTSDLATIGITVFSSDK
jgi:hypothetical protein